MPDPDPPTDELPGVTVTGHRRSELTQSFPSQPPPPYVPDVAVIEPFPPDPGPCDDPATREEYDADAAAARAMKKILQEIARKGEVFATREYGALIYRNPDGSVDFVRLEPGPGGGYGPPIDISGLDPSQILGYVHSHPGGTGYPSSADWTGTFTSLYNQGTAVGGDMSNLRLYIIRQISSYLDVKTEMYVYKGGDQSALTEGIEVNPEGRPCGG